MVVKILSPHKLLKVYKKNKTERPDKNTHKKPQKKTKVEIK